MNSYANTMLEIKTKKNYRTECLNLLFFNQKMESELK